MPRPFIQIVDIPSAFQVFDGMEMPEMVEAERCEWG
jgi:hypothetical protein